MRIFVFVAILAFVAAEKCSVNSSSDNSISIIKAFCTGEYGTTEYYCGIKDTNAKCSGTIRDNSRYECSSANWGTGNGKAKNGQCCSTSDDCKDTCNYFVCGKSL